MEEARCAQLRWPRERLCPAPRGSPRALGTPSTSPSLNLHPCAEPTGLASGPWLILGSREQRGEDKGAPSPSPRLPITRPHHTQFLRGCFETVVGLP